MNFLCIGGGSPQCANSTEQAGSPTTALETKVGSRDYDFFHGIFSKTSQHWDTMFSRSEFIRLLLSMLKLHLAYSLVCYASVGYFGLGSRFSIELGTRPRFPCTLRRGVGLLSRFFIVHCLLSAERILSKVLDGSSRSPEAESPK